MRALSRRLIRSITLWLVLAFALAALVNQESYYRLFDQLKPQSITLFKLDISFEADDEPINVETFIPRDEERQKVIHETVAANSFDYLVQENATGRIAQWSGQGGNNHIQYQGIVATQEVTYTIDQGLLIPDSYPETIRSHLQESDVIQVSHPEIGALWQSIKPNDSTRIYPVLEAIYHYTHEQIAWAPFKGTTSALTALRLKQASCNGKSRLFVALARLNNIPARLVGGVVLNEGSKKTSHQWVEAFIEGHWVPFGPTNGNFAYLPKNYLTLYRGDQVLFRHTADINFDYQFSIDRRLVAPSLYRVDLDSEADRLETGFNLTRLLLDMGLAPQVIGLFLLFPLCTLVLTFLRNVIGVKTFGIFMPMLIAAACVFTGLLKGLVVFLLILLISFIAYAVLEQLRMLRIARLAAVITINTMVFVSVLAMLGDGNRFELGMLSLFPVIIISYIAEQIHHLSSHNDRKELVLTMLGTLLSVWLCYLVLGSFLFEGLFSFHPEFYLLLLALQVYIGQWTGLRLNELYRFRSIIRDKANPVLGINGRNRDLVYRLNDRSQLLLASDKLQSKNVLREHGVPVPETLLVIDSLSRVNDIAHLPGAPRQFVIKPNQGAQGKGICVIVDRRQDGFVTAGGQNKSLADLRQLCVEIISGAYSQNGDTDIAYVEPYLLQHPLLDQVASFGLSDIRVIANRNGIVSAMLRMPTAGSDGKANLHQGAVGVAIDIDTGVTTRARAGQDQVTHHPDSRANLIGLEIPYWKQILKISMQSQKAIGLGYIGVDICIDKNLGPLVLEVNGRPGLEIQNIQNRGFRHEFQF